MQLPLPTAGLAAIYAIGMLAYLRSTRNSAESDLRTFAATVPAPLTEEVRRWLAPQLRRRAVYPFAGTTAGLVVGNALNVAWSDEPTELPWYWLGLLLCMGVGGTAGSLIAGYRTAPLVDGSIRAADATRRRLADVVGPTGVLRLRLAVAVSMTAALLAVAVAASSPADAESARRALLGCTLAAVLVVADYAVAALVASRPLVASTPEAMLWQRALVAKMLEATPRFDLVVAISGAAIALYVTVSSYDVLPGGVLALAGALALLTALTAGSELLGAWRERTPAPVPRERVRP